MGYRSPGCSSRLFQRRYEIMAKKKLSAEDAIRVLEQLDEDERERSISEIISNREAPLHGDLDMLLQQCLHAMKSAVHVFVACRDRTGNGGRMWAAMILENLKRGASWRKLLQMIPDIPEAVRALQILSPTWHGEPLWDDTNKLPRQPEYDRIRKAIRDSERHTQKKVEKAEEVFQLVREALHPNYREAFPGLESYLRLF
jgi:hypothetical protein